MCNFSLLKANEDKKSKDYSRICLPDNEKFNDLGHAMVAGYGRYRRAPCEVGRMGPEKFEYCGTAETCTKGSKVTYAAKFFVALLELEYLYFAT